MTKSTFRRGSLVATAAILALLASGYQLVSRSIHDGQRPGEVGYVVAHREGARVVKMVTGKAPNQLGWHSVLSASSLGFRYWDIDAKPWNIEVFSTSGRLYSIWNHGREHEEFRASARRRGVPGRTHEQARATPPRGGLYDSEAAWRRHLRAWATKFGVPADAPLVRFAWKHNGQVKDGDSSGYVGCYFQDRAGKDIAVVNCATVDGVLMYFGWRNRTE